jgi:hypothetical protein
MLRRLNSSGLSASSARKPGTNRFLDKTDDCVSREIEGSNDDEPSLGWTTAGSQGCYYGGTDDLEAETEHDEDSDPAEPSLGSVGDMHFNQEQWASGGRRDLDVVVHPVPTEEAEVVEALAIPRRTEWTPTRMRL